MLASTAEVVFLLPVFLGAHIVAPLQLFVLVFLCLIAFAVGADRRVCPVFRCRCFWAHTVAPLHCLSLCSFVLLSCRRGRPVCLPGCSLPVCVWAHTSVRPYIVCPCVLVSYCSFPVGADRCVCPIFLCLCVLGAHIGAPLRFLFFCSSVLLFFLL